MFPELSPSHKVQQELCFSGDASPPCCTLQVPRGLCWGWVPACPYQLGVPALQQGFCSRSFHLLRNLHVLVIRAAAFASSCFSVFSFCPVVMLRDWILQSAGDSKCRNFSSASKNYIIIYRVSGSSGPGICLARGQMARFAAPYKHVVPITIEEKLQDLCVLQTTWHRCCVWHQSPIPSPSALFPSCLQCLAFLCRPHMPRALLQFQRKLHPCVAEGMLLFQERGSYHPIA